MIQNDGVDRTASQDESQKEPGLDYAFSSLAKSLKTFEAPMYLLAFSISFSSLAIWGLLDQ